MNNQNHPYMQQLCLNCMQGFMIHGRCQNCGQPQDDPKRPSDALPLDHRLKSNRYRVGKVLGNGGFGITYMCWDSRYQSRVALKELFPTRATRNKSDQRVTVAPELQGFFNHVKQRFVDETNVIAQLRDEPLILNVYDFFEENGTAYYTMEYLEGTDLQHIFKAHQNKMDWNALERPMRQAMQGLGILHQHNFIHRDISPDNIFVCNDGTTKMIDFGSVRREDAGHFTTILKADFAPPELFFSNGNQGPWTDTYSLCATMYYLLSGGSFPMRAEPRANARATTGRDPIVPLANFKPAAPDYVLAAIMHGLNLEFENRFRSMEEMQKAFFPAAAAAQSGAPVILDCVRGAFAGRSFPIEKGEYLLVGRGATASPGVKVASYEMRTPGISRRHCVFYADQRNILYVRDLRSSYGTKIDNRPIPADSWVRVGVGQQIAVGAEEFLVRAAAKE